MQAREVSPLVRTAHVSLHGPSRCFAPPSRRRADALTHCDTVVMARHRCDASLHAAIVPLRSNSGARMRLIVHCPQPSDRNVRIELRGGQGRVAQQLLDNPQIGTPLEQMRRCAVP